jgi:5'-deoxynucleotidase YfbR-like HD superfamily hydrolase
MLSSEEVAQLAGAICATAETLGQTISATAAELMAGDLAEFSTQDIRTALQACRRELTGKLTLAAVLQRIQAEDGRPGRDEAWAIALASSDEFNTVVMTDEIQLALNAARPVLEAGDKIGARMAFISAYDRFVYDARAAATPVKWNLSMGFDPARRIAAVTAAVQLQRIPQERASLLLADLSHEPITEDGRAISGLLTGTVARPNAKLREKLKAVKDSMLAMRSASAEEKLHLKIAAANDLAARRALLIQQSQGEIQP